MGKSKKAKAKRADFNVKSLSEIAVLTDFLETKTQGGKIKKCTK